MKSCIYHSVFQNSAGKFVRSGEKLSMRKNRPVRQGAERSGSGEQLGQLCVFGGAAPGLFHRVLGGVLIHLGVQDLIQIQAAHIGHQDAVAQHVRQLFPDAAQLVPAFQVRAAPLEYLQQLRRLQGQGDGQVLGGVELPSLPVVPELDHPTDRLIPQHGCQLLFHKIRIHSARTAQRSLVEWARGFRRHS